MVFESHSRIRCVPASQVVEHQAEWRWSTCLAVSVNCSYSMPEPNEICGRPEGVPVAGQGSPSHTHPGGRARGRRLLIHLATITKFSGSMISLKELTYLPRLQTATSSCAAEVWPSTTPLITPPHRGATLDSSPTGKRRVRYYTELASFQIPGGEQY